MTYTDEQWNSRPAADAAAKAYRQALVDTRNWYRATCEDNATPYETKAKFRAKSDTLDEAIAAMVGYWRFDD